MKKFQTGTPSLEDVLEYYAHTTPSIKVVQQNDLGYKPLSSYGYDEGLAYGMNQNKLRAANQSFFDEIAWSAANSIPSTLFSIPEYFAQLYGMGAALYDGGKTAEQISNFFRPLKTWGDLYQLYTGEENSVGKVYTEGDNRAWWTEAIISGLPSSVASFGVAGAGIGRVISGATSLIHNNLLRAVGQNASKLSTGIVNFTNVGLTASALTGIEASMTGADVRSAVRQRFNTDAKFKQEIIQQALREGRNPEEVLEERMQKGYDTAFNTAFTTNLALNLTGVGALLKPANKIKLSVNNAAKQAISTGEDVLKAVDDVRIPNQLIKPNLVGETIQEGLEEFTQVVAQEAGKGVAFNNDPEGFIAAITKYGSKAFSGEGAASFILGALGGMGQKLISDSVGNNDAQEALETYKLKFADDVKTIRSATDRIQELAKSPEDNAEEIEYLQRELYKVSLSRALMNDNIDVLINELKGIQQLPNDKTLKQIANEEFVKFHSTLDNETFNMFQNKAPENIPAELKEQYTKFKELENKVINSPNLTPAQNAGLVEFNDEQLELLGINKDYVRTSSELINDLKSSYKEWKDIMDRTNPQTLEDYMYNLEIFLLQKDLDHLNLKQREEESQELQAQEKELKDKFDSFFNTNELDNTKPFDELIKDIKDKSLLDAFTDLATQKTDFISKNKDKIRAIQIVNETNEELKKLLTKEGKEEWLKNYNRRKEALNKSVDTKLSELNTKEYETRETDDIITDDEVPLEDKKKVILDRLEEDLKARGIVSSTTFTGIRGNKDLIDKSFVADLLVNNSISIDDIKEVKSGIPHPALNRRYVLINNLITFLNGIKDKEVRDKAVQRILTIKDATGKEYNILSLDNPIQPDDVKAVKVQGIVQEDTTIHKVFAYEAAINLDIDVSNAPMYVVVPKDATNLKVGVIDFGEGNIRVVQQRYELEASNKYSALSDALKNEEGEGIIINYRPLSSKVGVRKVAIGETYKLTGDIVVNYSIANSVPKEHSAIRPIHDILAHEAFHVMNKRIIKNLNKEEAKTIVNKTNQRIKEIHDYLVKTDEANYKDKFGFIYNQIVDTINPLPTSGLYEEFINEVLTNKAFQNYLKSKSFNHNETIFQKILQVIKDLFKSIFPDNLYQVSVSIINDLYKDTDIVNFAVLDSGLSNIIAKDNILEEDISDEDYNNFINIGMVSENILRNIANKIKFGITLTERETAIFVDNTSEINELLIEEAEEYSHFKSIEELKQYIEINPDFELEVKAFTLAIRESKDSDLLSKIKSDLSNIGNDNDQDITLYFANLYYFQYTNFFDNLSEDDYAKYIQILRELKNKRDEKTLDESEDESSLDIGGKAGSNTEQKDTDNKKSSSFTNEELIQVAQAIKDGTYKELNLANKEEILKYINRLVSDEGGKRDVVLDNILNKEKNELYNELYQAMDSSNKEAIQKVKAKIEAKYGNKTFQELRKKANAELDIRATSNYNSDAKVVKEIIKDLANLAPRQREIVVDRFPDYKYEIYKRNESYINEELSKISTAGNIKPNLIKDTGDVVDNSPSRMIYYDVSNDAKIIYDILQNEITDKAVSTITTNNDKKDAVKNILIKLKQHRESGESKSLEITIPELNNLNGTILRNLFYIKDNLAYTYFSPATSKFNWNDVQANNFKGLELLLSKNKNEDGTLDTSNIEFKYIKYKASKNIDTVLESIFGDYAPRNSVLNSDFAGYIEVRNKDTDEIFYTRLNANNEASIPEDIKQALVSSNEVLLQLKDNIPASFRLVDEFNTLNDVFDFPVSVRFVKGENPELIGDTKGVHTIFNPGEAYINVNGRVLEVAGKELNKEKEILDNIISQINSAKEVKKINDLLNKYIYTRKDREFGIVLSLENNVIKYSIDGKPKANLFTTKGTIAKAFVNELGKRRFNITDDLIDNPRINELVVVNVPKKTEIQYKSPFITFEVNINQVIENESNTTKEVPTEDEDDWGNDTTSDDEILNTIISEHLEIKLDYQDEIYDGIPLNEQDTLSLLEGMTSALFDFLDKYKLPVTSLLEGKIKQDNIYTAIHKIIYNPEFGKRLTKEQKAKLKPIFTDNNIWEKVKQAHKIYLSDKYDIEPVDMDDEVQEDTKDSAFYREAFTISNDSRYSTRTRLLLSTLNSGKVNSLGLNSPAQFREVYTVVSRIGVGKYGLGKQSFETIINELNKVNRPWAKQLVNRLHFEPEEIIDKAEQMILKANFLGDLDRAYITQWFFDYESGTIVNMHRVSIANGMINDFKIALQNLAKGGNILNIQNIGKLVVDTLNNAVGEGFKSFGYNVVLNALKENQGVIMDKEKISLNIEKFVQSNAVRKVFLDHIDKHPELLKSDNVISRFDGKLAYAISLRTVAHDILQQINDGVYVPNAYSEGSGLIELAKTKPIKISVLIGAKGVEDVQANRLTEGERIAIDIMAYKKQGMLLTPTHSDKATNYFITALSGEINKFGIYMEDLFKTELKIWYSNFGGRNKNNLIFYNEYFTKSELEAIRVRLNNEESIDTIYNEEIKGIEEYYNEFYQEELDRVKDKIRGINLPINKYDLEDYVRATIIQNMDLFRIVYGDPRYFKNVQDVNKRLPYIFSTKLFMVDDEEIRKDLKEIDGELFNFLDREDEKYKDSLNDFNKSTQLIVKSEVGASSNIDSIKQSLNLLIEEGIVDKDDVSALYEKGIDKTDAVAFVTLDEFRELKWRAQDWNLQLEKLYWKIRKGEEVKDAKVVFKPIKGQYGHNNNGKPIYDKTLFIPLIPEVIKGTRLEKLNNYMKANKLGYMIFDSGYKVPLDQDTTTFDELIAHIDNVEDAKTPYSEVIDYSGMGIQVLMGNTKEDKGPFPTQVNGIQTLDQAVNALIKREEDKSDTYYQKDLLDSEQEIYSKLGNKTKSENVIIKSWEKLKDATKAITTEGIISTRIKNSNEHFGNPFSHNPDGKTKGLIKTETVKEAVEKYIDWVLNSFNLEKKNLFTVTPRQVVDIKAIIKASIATQYIGFGEGINNSSTELYRQQAGKYANTGNYSYKDTIFVSIGGKRGTEQQQKEQQDRTIREAIKALDAGATLITDNAAYVESNSYNTGEKRLYDTLKAKGYKYSEKTIDGQLLGIWNKEGNRAEWIREQLKSGQLKGKPIFYYDELGEPSHATALDYLINNWEKISKTEILTKEQINFAKEEEENEIGINTNLDDYELFPGIFANKEQQQAIDIFKDFINSPITNDLKTKVALLKGRGGTGKTTIIKKITESIPESQILYIAPTHQAVRVLNNAVKNDSPKSTIESALGIKLDEETGKFTPDEYLISRGIPIQKAAYVIIDEASMIRDELVDYIIKSSNAETKIIFMGDNVQLPPVGQDKLSKAFNFTLYELKTRMRQQNLSPILPLTDVIANNIESDNIQRNIITDRTSKFNEETNDGVIFEKSEATTLNLWKNDFIENPTNTKIITFNNQNNNNSQSVKNINEKARKLIFPNETQEFIVGELLTAYNSFYEGDIQKLKNSSTYRIESISEVKNKNKTIIAISKKLGTRFTEINFDYYEVTLRDIYSDELVYIELPTRKSKLEIKKIEQSYYGKDNQMGIKIQQHFPDLEYGYAITSHKAQGSTYRNVYVLEDNILGNSLGTNKSVNQSLYTSISRASNKVVIQSNKNSENNKQLENKTLSQDSHIGKPTNQSNEVKQDNSINNNFDKELAQKLQDKLEKLYPEIKLNITNNPIWEQGDNIFNQEEFNNQVNYRLKATEILLSDKAKKVFEKGKKANWDLNKILTELQVPKEQKKIILDLGITDREQLALELANNYSYTVEINTAKYKELKNYIVEEIEFQENPITGEAEEYIKKEEEKNNSKYYLNLTVNEDFYKNNPDWEYKEQRITTPLISPSIKGHAEFAEYNDIGWFRAWYNKKTGEVHVLELQSDLFQKGRDKKDLFTNKGEIGDNLLLDKSEFEKINPENFPTKKSNKGFGTTQFGYSEIFEDANYYYTQIDSNEYGRIEKSKFEEKPSKENQFLQLLNKDNNWVTFFIKSIIQDSAKKGYEKVLFPTGNTASKVEGHTTLEEFKKQKEDRIKSLEATNEKIKKGTFNTSLISNDPRYADDLLDKNIEEIEQLKQELERVEREGFGSLRPIYNFYENAVNNILKKQDYSPVLVTDEYGNTWNEITINQVRDLANVLLQRNEANQIIGQANIKAATVLIDAINQKQDTLPHEYAHHYIAWFRDTPIVQEAIKKWGSEEALVQSIGEQVVKQKGETNNWWNNFVKWIMNKFNSLSKLQKEELTQILTDAFLTRQDLRKDANKEEPAISKQERLDRLKQAYNDWFELEVRNLEGEFGIYNGKITDYELFYDKVQELLDTNDRDIKRSLNTDRRFILNPYARLIQNKINSILEKRLINREFTGAGYLQSSTIGMEYTEENIRVDRNLKFYRYEGGDSTLPAEAAIPLPSEMKYLLDKYESIDAINKAYQEGKISKIRLSGARIPVQGYPSMEVFEVKYFLPPHVSYIIVPEEITKKAGSDFDGDKLYLFRRTSKSITYDKDKHYKRYVAQNVSNELSKLKSLYKKRKEIEGEWEEVRNKLDELSDLYNDIRNSKFIYESKKSAFKELPNDIKSMYKIYDSNLEYTGKLKQLSYLEFTKALINKIKQANLEDNKGLNTDYYGTPVILDNELIPIFEEMVVEYEQSIRDIESFQNNIREKLTGINTTQKSILDDYKLEKSTNLNDILEASEGLKGIELFKKLAEDNGLYSYEEFNEYYHTKEELQNEILDNINGLLLDKTNYTSLISSVDTNYTKKWLEDNDIEIDNTIKEYKDLASVTKQNTVWFNNNSGKRLVGIFARHNKHHAFAQQIGMKLRKELVKNFAFKSSIKNGEVSFADVFNTQGIKISSGIGEHISMGVDIAKGDYLSPAGVRENSASIKMLFARAGVNNDLINKLFTHPTVVKFFNAMSINRLRPKYDRNEKRSKIHQALMAIRMEYEVDNKNKPKNGVFSYTTKDGVKFINPTIQQKINFDNLSTLSNEEIIGKLLEMMIIADNLNTVMDFNNPDTKGLDISYFDNIVHAVQKKDAKSMFVDANGDDALHSINNNTIMFPFNQGQRLGALINNELFAFSSDNTPARFIEINKKDINNSKSTYIYKLTYENYITKLVYPKRKINVEVLAAKLKNIFTTLTLESKIDNEKANVLRIKEAKLDEIERQERKNTIMDMYSKGELTSDDLIDLAVLSLRQNKFGSVANILQVIPYKAFELLDYDISEHLEIELDRPPIFTQDVLEYQLFKVNSQLKLCK